MIQNCVPLVAAPEDVFFPAAAAVKSAIVELGLWQLLIESHFSYNAASEGLRNRFAFNGLLTALANALVNSACPLPETAAMFVSTRLDWTNTLENTPLTALVYSKSCFPQETEEAATAGTSTATTTAAKSDDEDSDDDAAADPEPTLLSPARKLQKGRIELLVSSQPKAVGAYSSPPRPRTGDSAAIVEDDFDNDASVAAEPSGDAPVSLEISYNEISFWSIPIGEI